MKSNFLRFGLLVILLCSLTISGLAAEADDWVTANRIGNPDAEIVLTANIQRSDTLKSPYNIRKDYIRKAAAAWAKENPNAQIQIQVAPAGQISMTMAKIMTQAEVGNAPDFAHIDSFWVGRFIDRGILKPLNGYLTDSDIEDFFGFTKDVTMKDGKMYAIWGETDARYMYYRKDWIENPPRTWDEVIDTALAMKEEHNAYGYMAWLGTWEGAVNGNVWPSFWAQGGRMFDESGRPVIGEGKNKEALINSLGFLKRLVDSGAAPRMVASITSGDQLIAEARANNVAMIANGSWFYGQLADVGVADQWGIAPLPQMEADQMANSNGGWTWAVLSEDPVKQELAASYIMKVVGNKEAMAERCKVYNYLPTRQSVYDADTYFSTNPQMQLFAESLKYGNARPANALYGNISDIVQKALGSLLIGQSDDVEAEVDKIQAEALKAWQEN